ncbi:MAG: DUF5719 family protein [Candidatus Geothermincolia bacterium]
MLANPNGAYGTIRGGFHLTSGTTWYLAEGSNAWGFGTYIYVQNPNREQVTARVTFMDAAPAIEGKGKVYPPRDIILPPESLTVVNPTRYLGDTDFSTMIQCLEGKTIAVDRQMDWKAQDSATYESHSSIGVTSPSTTWYLPEGSSAWGFETWTLVENPAARDARVTLTYMVEGAGVKSLTRTVPAYSRATFSMEKELGASLDASVKVTSDTGVIAEQSVYRNNMREGSCSIGADEASTEFFLSEGSTAWGFTTYILVQNPNDTTAEVSLTYNTPTGPVAQPRFAMPANARKTIRVNDVLPDSDFSTQVRGSKPIIAERSMYWGEGTPRGEACHASIGLDSPHTRFNMPDGQAWDDVETFTLVQNPNPGAARIAVTYMTITGNDNKTIYDTIPAGSRRTYRMSEQIRDGYASITVRSLDGARPIIVERSMYWHGTGAGTNTIGAPSD